MDDSFVRIVVGPVGSSKTTAFCAEVLRRAFAQEPSPRDNCRHFKAAIVRNTMPELWRTTIETWLAVFPEAQFGPLRRSAPVSHQIEIPPNDATGEPGLKLGVDFFAMDKPDQVRQLLSYEGTLIWFNEVREIPRAIVKAATDRAGRYPSQAKNGCMPTWFGVMGDTNPPDEDHWIYEFYCEPPENYKVYKQPPGVFEAKREELDDGRVRYFSEDPRAAGLDTYDENRALFSGGTWWIANPDAENLVNLPLAPGSDGDYLGKGGYYLFRVSGKDREWIRGYYQGDFGPVFDGKPVIPEFNRDIHVSESVEVLDGVPVYGGFDIGAGTLASAAVFGQRHPSGVWLIHDEVQPDDEGYGLKVFADLAQATFATRFPDVSIMQGTFYGDPAGRVKDGVLETTYFDHLATMGLPVMEAPSNDPRLRIEAIKAPHGRMVLGGAGILIHPRCRKLIKALQGAWCYKRVQAGGSTERYRDVPDKNEYSHGADALGYMLLGAGEGNSLRGRDRATNSGRGTVAVNTSFNVLG